MDGETAAARRKAVIGLGGKTQWQEGVTDALEKAAARSDDGWIVTLVSATYDSADSRKSTRRAPGLSTSAARRHASLVRLRPSCLRSRRAMSFTRTLLHRHLSLLARLQSRLLLLRLAICSRPLLVAPGLLQQAMLLVTMQRRRLRETRQRTRRRAPRTRPRTPRSAKRKMPTTRQTTRQTSQASRSPTSRPPHPSRQPSPPSQRPPSTRRAA